MKNTKIIQAWNTVSPTAAQKKRMRSALEAKLTAHETPPRFETPDLLDFTLSTPEKIGKHTQKARPQYQVIQPKKNRGSAFAAVAALLAVVIAGGLFLGVMTGNQGGTPSFAAPKETEDTRPTESTKPTELPEAYQNVIGTYVTAIEEGWNPEQCNHADISILTANVQSTEDLGYALMDLDSDGEEELLITDGNVIYSLYSMTPEKEAVCFLIGMERDAYYLSDNGIIANVGSGSAAISYFIFYKFSNDTLDVIQQLTYDAYTDPENPWFTGDMEEKVTEEQANAIIDAYPHRYISHTTLSGQPPLQELAVPNEETLNGYARQLSSLLAGGTKENYQLYCFYDYDGDGETELLLGAGNSAYAVLEPGQGGSTPFLISPSGAAYPCEDRVMEHISYAQGYTQFTFRKYGGEDGGAIQDYVYTDGETWYRMDENGEGISISEEEAQTIRGKYKYLNLPWKDVSEFPVTILTGERTPEELYEKVFLPVATSKTQVTGEELEQIMTENGFQWQVGNDKVYCYASDTCYTAVYGKLENGVAGPVSELEYFVPGELDRLVSVKWVPAIGEKKFLKNLNYDFYQASDLTELRDFLALDENTLELWASAEVFTHGYFAQNSNMMMGRAVSDKASISQREMYERSLDVEIQEMKGLDDVEARYLRDGYVEVTSAVIAESPDSYTYLTMEMVKENDQWKVHNWWLEK